MKKFLTVASASVLALSLTACGEEDTSSSNVEEPVEEAAPAEQKEVSNGVPEPKEDENGRIVLDTAGQTVEDEGFGTVELLKIKQVNETININPLVVTVQDIKLFKVTNPTDEAKEMINLFANQEVGDSFTYFQINYNAENTEEKNIDWYDLMNVVTDKGQQIDGQMTDFISDEGDADSQFLGKVKKEYTDGFIVNDEDINKVKLIFGYTIDSSTYENITEEQQVEYTFD